MKTSHILLTGALALGAISAANAATLITLGPIGTSNAPTTDIFGGTGTNDGNKEREVKRTTDDAGAAPSARIMAGQTFTVLSGSSYELNAIWLKQVPSTTWATNTGSFEIKLLDLGVSAQSDATLQAATVMKTWSFSDKPAPTATNTWLRFGFDGSDVATVAAGGVDHNYAFAMYFDAPGALNHPNFDRATNKATDAPAYQINIDGGSGSQFEQSSYTAAAWASAAPTGSTTLQAGGRDFLYQLEGTVVPEPSSTALLGLAGLAFMIRRRR